MDWYAVTATPEPSPEETEARDRIQSAWKGAPMQNLEVLSMLLDVAREQVIEYAPVLAEGAEIPSRYVYAQLQQIKNLWNAGNVSSDGDLGGDGYTYTPRPLDKTIKNIIRPADGKPHVL